MHRLPSAWYATHMSDTVTADPRAWGIQDGYDDVRGEWRATPNETTARLLASMHADGSPVEGACLFSSSERVPDLAGALSLETEDGGEVPIHGELPADLPWGYHKVTFASGAERVLVHGPGKCYLPAHLQVWGWAVQLPSLLSRDSWGIGDLRDLERFGRSAREQGAEVALLNPLHASNPGPQHRSPYFPSSRCLRDPLYLRIEDVPGASAAGLDFDPLDTRARALNDNDTIDRDAVHAIKMEALRALFEPWTGNDRFATYIGGRGTVFEDLCTYMALATEHGGGHRTWDDDYLHPRSPAVKRWREDHRREVTFQMWLQWLLDEQLQRAGKGIGLIQDLAVGVDPWGADAWLWQDVFADDVTVGAPPDIFSPSGQDWGVPPFDPWKLRAAGYEPFITLLRSCLAHGAGARIDHVMGLFRLWWVPRGLPATEGAYVTYPSDDLLDILALESHRARAFVVGEDLGTVEPRVRAEMERRDLLSYKLALFEDGPPEEYPERALAAITNHDLPTIAGLWDGSDLAELKQLGLETDDDAWSDMRAKVARLAQRPDDADVSDVIPAAYGRLARAGSRVLIATLEDATGMPERVNVPGTTDDQRPNWSKPLPAPLDELAERTRQVALMMDRPPGIAQRDVSLPSVRLNVAEAGDGPLVVMLHGFPEFWRTWRFQIAPVARAGWHVVAPDMRGFNLSDKPDGIGSYAIEELCDDVRHLIESYGRNRACIVGHDWGGIVAWFFAMTYPDMVDKLTIVNVPHPSRYQSGAANPRQLLKSWYIAFFQLPWLPEAALRHDDFRALRDLLRRSPGFGEDVIEEYVEAARRSDALHYPINYYRSFLRRNLFGMLRDLNVIERPTLVIWGDRDHLIERDLAEPDPRLVPDLRVEHLPEATHWPHVDEPDVVNRLLLEHLGEPG